MPIPDLKSQISKFQIYKKNKNTYKGVKEVKRARFVFFFYTVKSSLDIRLV